MHLPAPDRAARLIEESTFVWYQKFELAPGVWTPGVADSKQLLAWFELPEDLCGVRALDIGTANGAVAFELERRGAEVTAIDIYDERHFGFRALADLVESRVIFHQASVYEVREVTTGFFDLIVFFGVLYHLRHPLLALDRLRHVASGRLLLETAVCDHDTPGAGAIARFYRRDELAGDASNWFAPNLPALIDWVESAGFCVSRVLGTPPDGPSRAAVDALLAPGTPEYELVSYERAVGELALDR